MSGLILIAAFRLATILLADTPVPCQPGALDTSFNGTGIVISDFGNSDDGGLSVALQRDGKIVVVGYSDTGSSYQFAVARYNNNGSLDASFDGTGKVTTGIGGIDDEGSCVAIQIDDKIVVAGQSYNGSNDDFAVVRYNRNGSLDTSFNATGKVTTPVGSSHDYGRSVAIQSDGKIVVAGFMLNSNSNYDFAVVRYNSNGSLDTSFNGTGKVTTPIGNSADEAYSVVIQNDGKIVVAGSSYNGFNDDIAIVRYNSDGSLDTSFNGTGKLITAIGTGYDEGYSVALQSDGKIVAAGQSDTGSTVDVAVVRCNSDGSLDTSLNGTGKVTTPIGTSTDRGLSVAIQGDRKIVVAGSSYNGPSSFNDFAVVRYNSDGSLDTSFNGTGKVTTPVGSSHDFGYSVAIQSDGEIVVAGVIEKNLSDFAIVRYIGVCVPLQLSSAASRKSHGSLGNFDIDLPNSGQPGVECRTGGASGNHTLVFIFSNQIVSGNANVTSGTGTVSGSPGFSGNMMTVNLTGVTNAQTLTVTLSGVTDQFSEVLPDTPVSVKVLIGDTTGNGSVNASDVTQAKGQSGQPVTSGNFRIDVNANGVINGSDVAIIKAHSGESAAR